MSRREQAEKYFSDGYNCAQSVVLTFVDVIGLDKETVLKISSSFGGGLGRLREVCGVVSGMAFVIGAVKGYSNPEDNDSKMKLYGIIQNLAGQFKQINRSIICRELIDEGGKEISPVPEKRTAEYYAKRPCKLLCGDAAEILENYLLSEGIINKA